MAGDLARSAAALVDIVKASIFSSHPLDLDQIHGADGSRLCTIILSLRLSTAIGTARPYRDDPASAIYRRGFFFRSRHDTKTTSTYSSVNREPTQTHAVDSVANLAGPATIGPR